MMGEYLTGFEAFLAYYTPTIMSIIGMISTYVVALKRIKGNKTDIEETRNEMLQDQLKFKKSMQDDFRAQSELMNELLKENLELKSQNKLLKTYFTRVRDDNDDRDKEGKEES